MNVGWEVRFRVLEKLWFRGRHQRGDPVNQAVKSQVYSQVETVLEQVKTQVRNRDRERQGQP